MAAQTFIRWSHHGVWERLLELAQQREGLQLGMAFLDGTTIRLRLLKIAVRVRETTSRIRLAFAANCPDAALFRGLVGRLILRPG